MNFPKGRMGAALIILIFGGFGFLGFLSLRFVVGLLIAMGWVSGP